MSEESFKPDLSVVSSIVDDVQKEFDKNKAPQSKKFDAGKSRVDLIPAEVLMGIGDIFAFGADKYKDEGDGPNWRHGLKYSKLIGGALRHIFKFKMGIDLDEESGKSHLLHAMCNLIMLYYASTRRKDLDDRKWETNEDAAK